MATLSMARIAECEIHVPSLSIICPENVLAQAVPNHLATAMLVQRATLDQGTECCLSVFWLVLVSLSELYDT